MNPFRPKKPFSSFAISPLKYGSGNDHEFRRGGPTPELIVEEEAAVFAQDLGASA